MNKLVVIRQLAMIRCLLLLLCVPTSSAWTIRQGSACHRRSSRISLSSSKPPELLEVDDDTTATATYTDVDAPAGIVGAAFFGGSNLKQDLFDPVAEALVGRHVDTDVAVETVHRFSSTASEAFDEQETAAFAKALQEEIQRVLSSWKESSKTSSSSELMYSSTLRWDTPFPASSTSDDKQQLTRNPLGELQAARQFFRELHVAVTSGRRRASSSSMSDSNNSNIREEYELTWEISLVWPLFWEPRVLLTGSSRVTVEECDDSRRRIVQQVDRLDQSDLFSALLAQLLPRFWDMYHIGMTPSTEQSPQLKPPARPRNQSFLRRFGINNKYQLQTLPGRWYLQASLQDLVGTASDGLASSLPNHAFSTAIKTMGPQKQTFVPCSPIQIQIQPLDNNTITWSIPVAVQTLASNTELPLPEADPEVDANRQPQATYVWIPQRTVATLAYGGQPQDAQVAVVRKQLYEAVLQDGWQPEVDANTGRPLFLFWQDAVKACYTDDGLGMVVYEWRPQFTKPCRIGIVVREKESVR
jgi:hypothetical protein